MIVSRLERQQKRSHRISVYVDDEFFVGLTESALMKSGLTVGQELSQQEKQDLLDLAHYDMAREKALGLLARRPRSKWELELYLKSKSYQESMIKALIEDLSSSAHVDDVAFAGWWVEQRRLLKSVSKNKLKLELRQKRVDEHIIEQALKEDATEDITIIRELIWKKQQQARYRDKQKLMQYLARQGFRYGDIKIAFQDDDDS